MYIVCLVNFNYLIMTAAQMKTLVRYLPLAIGQNVPVQVEHWACFVVYWEICNVALAFEITEEDSSHLEWLVEVFLEMFKSLYGDTVNFTHQLIHLASQMLR